MSRASSLTTSTISTRQLYISNQVNRARKKVIELEEMSTILRSTSQSSRSDKLELALDQIKALKAQIHELESQRRSAWGLGRSDEAPPGYTDVILGVEFYSTSGLQSRTSAELKRNLVQLSHCAFFLPRYLTAWDVRMKCTGEDVHHRISRPIALNIL
ncbi:hypothetical protein DFH09DRAFT_1069831 [Mycena vulgaris]|nr:hypothetical protein DFH09DRAFT_1069831 [Mycena vulgaris]